MECLNITKFGMLRTVYPLIFDIGKLMSDLQFYVNNRVSTEFIEYANSVINTCNQFWFSLIATKGK